MRSMSSPLSRRDTILGLSSLAAFASCAFGSRPTSAAAQGTHTFKLGAFEVTVISDGFASLPLPFVLPGIPATDYEPLLKANGLPVDGIIAPINVTIVKTPDALVLIDTGGGGDFMPTMGRFSDALEAAGFKPEAVTHVIFTHAHADHLWGVIDPLDGGTRYPNARHFMTAVEFDYWMTPDRETKVPEPLVKMAVGSARRLKILADRLEKPKPGTEIMPGVTLIDTAGHTPGHVSVLLKSGAEQLLVGADALTHPVVSFAKPEWRWGSDVDVDLGITTRKRTLDFLATDKIPLLGYHLPWPGVGRVERQDLAYRFVAGT